MGGGGGGRRPQQAGVTGAHRQAGSAAAPCSTPATLLDLLLYCRPTCWCTAGSRTTPPALTCTAGAACTASGQQWGHVGGSAAQPKLRRRQRGSLDIPDSRALHAAAAATTRQAAPPVHASPSPAGFLNPRPRAYSFFLSFMHHLPCAATLKPCIPPACPDCLHARSTPRQPGAAPHLLFARLKLRLDEQQQLAAWTQHVAHLAAGGGGKGSPSKAQERRPLWKLCRGAGRREGAAGRGPAPQPRLSLRTAPRMCDEASLPPVPTSTPHRVHEVCCAPVHSPPEHAPHPCSAPCPAFLSS